MEAPRGMEHPGVLHLYCHLMELSDDPTAAMPAANALRTLYPFAGHLTHMASHIDIWAGQYKVGIMTTYICSSTMPGSTDGGVLLGVYIYYIYIYTYMYK